MYQKDTWTCHGWQDRSRIRLQGIVRHLNQTSSSSHSLRGHLSVSLHRLTTLGLLSPGPTLLRDQQEGSNTQEGAADWPERFRHPSVDLIHSDPCPGTCLQVMNSRWRVPGQEDVIVITCYLFATLFIRSQESESRMQFAQDKCSCSRDTSYNLIITNCSLNRYSHSNHVLAVILKWLWQAHVFTHHS